MENILENLLTNKIFIIIMILLIALLAYSLLKKLLKLIIFLLIALILYVSYMTYTGQELPSSSNELIKQVREKFSEVQKESQVVIDSVQKIKKVNEAVNQSKESESE